MTRRAICIAVIAVIATLTATAQKSLDFASKFMTLCQGDTTVSCVTVSPKMMEQLGKMRGDEEQDEQLAQAIAKIKTLRMVSAPATLYQRAEELLKRNGRRFALQKEYQGDNAHGAFYTRQDRRGSTVELIMLREDDGSQTLTIVDLTGNIDEEFLCFLYNISFKN